MVLHVQQQEINASAANDSAEVMQWMSVVDEQDGDVADISSLPALEGLLERMESQAGCVVTNEFLAVVGESCTVRWMNTAATSSAICEKAFRSSVQELVERTR